MADDDANKVAFEVVTPTKLVSAADADMVVVPGAEGDIGVLPGHTPLITTLRPGVLDVHDGGKVVDRIFVAGGFAEATPYRCTVLADEAVPVVEIDRATATERLNAARTALDEADDVAREAAEAALHTAEAYLAAAVSHGGSHE